ncbi:hypothetical protein [Luteimonas deserti]|uniref:Uncharacterized protein n=1 Tax=Luteimonas deserti TaxID=2752306 RepID=A0A7Z0TZX9_9GAMM|nr:hypothetical protein [Luteimonas deserti]NYZ62708.1 hypothetical protein [Luteimonas deserti]
MGRTKWIAVFLCLTVLAVGLTALFRYRNSPQAGPALSANAPTDTTIPANDDPLHLTSPAASGVTATGAAQIVSDPFPGIKKDRHNTALEDDMFGPQSKAEQAWLQRNGYPTKEQIQAYSVATDAALEQASRRGDQVAQTFLDMRKLMEGDESAEVRLLDQVAKGYTYPLLSMAGYYAGSQTGRDVPKAYSYTRVLEMLGDTKMGLVRDMLLPAQPDPSQKLEAESQALAHYNALLQRRRELVGPNAPPMDPRPTIPD